MNYILTNKDNNYKSENLKEYILKLRGIKDPQKYLHLNKDASIPFDKLDNIQEGVKCLIKHIDNNNDIYIQIDNDVDGICSATMLYNYLKKICKNNIFYGIGEGKTHGINANYIIKTYPNVKLVLIPDAGSNQIIEHKALYDKGIDTICLDHHNTKEISKYAIIINNQISQSYLNKQFCGTGIVYKFLQALDQELWENHADDDIDLLALSLISDMMDIREYETKYYIDIGLKNVKNKMFKTMLLKQGYSMNYNVTPINIAFYIVPLINSFIRYNPMQDKIKLFKVFADIDTDHEYEHRTRKKDDNGNPIIEMENTYEYMTRKCVNAHSKQYREKNKIKKIIIEDINKLQIYKNKIIIYNVTGIARQTLTGLLANDIAQYYNKPCVLLRNIKDDLFGGSGRNIDSVDLPNLQQFLLSSKLFNFVEGHENAHGVNINKENINKLIKFSNNKLKNISFIKRLDFCIPFEELTDDFIETIDEMSNLWGQYLKEPIIEITNVYASVDDINLIGKKKNTLKFESEDISFIKFNSTNEEYENLVGGWDSNEKLVNLNVIGTCGINKYNGKETLQINIKDYEKI